MNASTKAKLRLLWDLARRDLQTRFAGSHFGIVWAFVVPLFSSVVFILVFGVLMKGNAFGAAYQKFDFTTFYFLGFAPWLLFSDVLGRSTGVIRENKALVRNVRMDFAILPASQLLTSCLAHLIVLALCLALVAYNGYPLSARLYLLPVYFVLLCAFSLGLAYLVAALSVYVSDLAYGVPIVVNLWFFCTPILYTPQFLEQDNSRILRFAVLKANPMTWFVDAYRTSIVDVAFDATPRLLAVTAVLAVGAMVVGYSVFRRLSKGFNDVI